MRGEQRLLGEAPTRRGVAQIVPLTESEQAALQAHRDAVSNAFMDYQNELRKLWRFEDSLKDRTMGNER